MMLMGTLVSIMARSRTHPDTTTIRRIIRTLMTHIQIRTTASTKVQSAIISPKYVDALFKLMLWPQCR